MVVSTGSALSFSKSALCCPPTMTCGSSRRSMVSSSYPSPRSITNSDRVPLAAAPASGRAPLMMAFTTPCSEVPVMMMRPHSPSTNKMMSAPQKLAIVNSGAPTSQPTTPPAPLKASTLLPHGGLSPAR